MTNDLQIAGVALPAVVTAPCPLKVAVDVVNRGPDPAAFQPAMTVCLDIRVSDRLAHYSYYHGERGAGT